MGLSGINWNKSRPLIFLHLGSKSSSQKEELIEKCLQQVIELDQENKSAKIVVVSDGQLNCAYKMEFGKFTALWKLFFTLPQHTYVYFLDSKRCLNYTFEGELIFG